MPNLESKGATSKSLGKRKDRQGSDNARRAKKPRADIEESAQFGLGDTSVIARNTPKNSLLQQGERAFPRGGGSLLTPVERKQIEIQATKDVLYEEAGGKRSQDDTTLKDDLAEDVDAARPTSWKKQKSSKRKSRDLEEGDALEPQIRADGLKPKRLVPGCLVLGTISQIHAHSLSLDLPNNLRGNVSITAISKTLTQKLEALAAAEETEDGRDTRDHEEDIDLKAHFNIGQYLRACVVAPADSLDEDSGKTKRVQLSTDPRLTNQGMAKPDISVNTVLQASVISVEDHGLVMDLGIEDSSVKGFMSTKEVSEDVQVHDISPGAVFLCLVIGMNSNGSIIKLSASLRRAQSIFKSEAISMPLTVKSLLPGLAVEVLVSQVGNSIIAGKVMGSINASADVVHSGAGSRKANIESKYKPGMKVRARIIFANPGSQNDTLGISILEHVLSLSPRRLQQNKVSTDPTVALPIGSIIDQAKVVNVEPGLGVYTDVGVNGIPAFVHISRVSDGRVESLSQSTGTYRSGTSHRARIIGYNAVDGMFLASFEKSVLEEKYIRIDDIPVGELLQVKVEKIVINPTGVAGLLVNIAKGINGFVPEIHMSDVRLQHPERKFKEGISVPARVLSVNKDSRQVRLTLKKALVTTDAPIWTKYDDVTANSESVGTIQDIKREGAIVRFFGPVKAFLPVSQMSDAFIDDPAKHFRIGQTVKVHVLSVDPTLPRMTVTCRIPSAAEAAESAEYSKLKAGQLVNGTVVEKSIDDISLEIKDSKLRASLPMNHFTDGSEQKCASAMKHIRVGQTMSDLLIVELFPKKRSIMLSNKPSLVGDAKDGKFLTQFEETNPDMKVNGFVRNVTDEGVFIGFGNGLTGLLHRSQVTDRMTKLVDFGLRKDQSIAASISYVDYSQLRFNLSMKDNKSTQDVPKSTKVENTPVKQSAGSPGDAESISLADFTIGKLTTAQISSVKDTQLNVRLAKNVQGRIDVSEAFSKWEDIKDIKYPLRAFHANETLPVRILGIHDARNHRFLPISHRSGKVPVFELSAKVANGQSLLSLDQMTVGSWLTAFVNNISERCLWVNVSPNVRGRIDLMDISEDVSVLGDLDANFPIGSAMRVRVKNIDLSNGRLDLSAKEITGDSSASFDSLAVGMITSGRVTKVTERSVIVQLGPNVAGSIYLTELSDEFSQADPGAHSKNDVLRVCVLDIDKSNKRIILSARPSKVLSSSLKVTDPYVASIDQLKVNDIVRGFVKNVADAGLFVFLSHNVTAFVRVAELSDTFIKDWKASFEVDQLVTGKIIAIDASSKHVQMSLKASVVSKNYVPLFTFNDLSVGKVITGKVRKVEEFGAFIVVDNSHNVSGLCHRSEMAEQRVPDARKLYEEGDAVKAIVLKIEPEKRRVSFGLKASYFENGSDGDIQTYRGAPESEESSESDDDMDLVEAANDEGAADIPIENGSSLRGQMVDSFDANASSDVGLEAGAFDWTGGPQQDDTSEVPSDADQGSEPTKKHRRKSDIQVDHTADLDTLGPRSANDFERLLLGQRDSSSLWVQYMAFYLQLSEIGQARQVAERALREINMREQEEKMNVWVAYLNLENAYGTDDAIEEVFTRACEVNDAQEMHERLTSIYIESGKHKKADDLFQAMTQRKAFTPDPKLWLNYANFLMSTLAQTDRARGMLERGMKSVPSHLHRDLVSKFAQLEFKCKNGDPERGRTMFERLLDTYPKKWDLWDILIEMEASQGERSNVRGLYERMTSVKMKSRRAKFAFKRWLEFEEENTDQKMIDHVKAKAAEFVQRQKSAQGEENA